MTSRQKQAMPQQKQSDREAPALIPEQPLSSPCNPVLSCPFRPNPSSSSPATSTPLPTMKRKLIPCLTTSSSCSQFSVPDVMTSSSSPCQTVITPTRISSATIQNVLSTDKNIADAIEAIRSMKHETHEIATTVVLQRILDVNGQLQQFQAKQLEHMIIQHAKRRKLSDEADIQSTVSLDENTEESNKLVEKINGFNRDESALCQESEMKERFMILQNAAKMKRLSQLFRNLESIQGMIIHELQYS